MSEIDSTGNSGPGPPVQLKSLSSPTKPAAPGSSKSLGRDSGSRRGTKIGHRRVTEEGTVTYKKKPTSEIQQALQLGIQHHIGSIQKERARDVLYRDFQTIDTVQFPACGTKTTPAHSLSDFRFKTYAPIAFRNFRTRYKLDIRDFLNSICSRELRELSNPGASGSIFYITQDDEFIIKTVQHREGEFLRALLPSYFMNLWQHPPTLLPKFHGFYCYQTSRKNIRFVIMNNLLPSSVKIHEKYDLKGSTHKRRASAKELAKSSPTLKDLDFVERHPDGIWLEAETYDALMRTIEQDCLVLESLQIMDYSLLLGVHNLDQAKRERLEQQAAKQTNSVKATTASGGDEVGVSSAKRLTDESNPNGFQPDGVGVRQKISPVCSPGAQPGSGSGPDSFRWARAPPGADGEKMVTISSDVPSESSPPRGTFERDASRARSTKRLAAYCTAMESIEASAKPVELDKEEMDLIPSGGIPARNSNGDRLLLFLGIIDILQSYRLIKKLEHGFKAIAIDGRTVSVTPPSFYSQRFQESLSRHVFKRIQSLDQPTLLGPNAMRFRRFVEMAMKQASSKRAVPPGRLPLPTVRSSDEDEGQHHIPGVTRPAVLSPSISRNGSVVPTTPSIIYSPTSNSVFFPDSAVWNRPPSTEIKFPPAPELRGKSYETRAFSHSSTRFGDPTRGSMGPNPHDQHECNQTSTARRYCSSCELNLRPCSVQHASLSIDAHGGSPRRRTIYNRLVEYQRNARSHMQLNQCSGKTTQHSGRVPSHLLNELITDLSRAESHLSMVSVMTTSSESGVDGDDHQHSSRASIFSDGATPVADRSIVTPEHPRIVKISTAQSKVRVGDTPPTAPTKCTNYRTSPLASSNPDILRVLNGEVKPGAASRYMRHADKVRTNPVNTVCFDSLPASLIKRRLPVDPQQGAQASGSSTMLASKSYSRLSNADSLEYFMQDAVLRFRETAYDPYGLARKNLSNQLNTGRPASSASVNRNSRDSMTSSGRCSLMSANSIPRVPVVDRRRKHRHESRAASSYTTSPRAGALDSN